MGFYCCWARRHLPLQTVRWSTAKEHAEDNYNKEEDGAPEGHVFRYAHHGLFTIVIM